MDKLKQSAGDIFSRISSGFTYGLGQMAAVGQDSYPLPYTGKSFEDAFRGDWQKVGSDLGRAIDTTRERHREKAS